MLLKVRDIHKSYSTGTGKPLHVLKGIDLTVEEGSITAIVGASGTGKSTLLHIVGTLDTPDSGIIMYEDNDISTLGEKEISRFRNKNLGFVFQFHHLLPEFTAAENVAIPAMIGGVGREEAMRDAQSLLEKLNLLDRAHHKPAELSGGEQQRVAVARSLINHPRLVLADEPSGNLDEENGSLLHSLLMDLTRENKLTFIIVTHNMDFARGVDSMYRLHEGILFSSNI